MIRVVLDTNVLVSALLSDAGNESRLVHAARRGAFLVYVTTAVLAEYMEVTGRAKFGFATWRLEPLRTFLNTRTLQVVAEQIGPGSPDPSDTKFIACAMAANADFLVTGNRRHFPAERYGSAAVVNARELLAQLG